MRHDEFYQAGGWVRHAEYKRIEDELFRLKWENDRLHKAVYAGHTLRIMIERGKPADHICQDYDKAIRLLSENREVQS
jgi:hypothetical protein